MKAIIFAWMLLIIHKKGLCKPFHWKEDGKIDDDTYVQKGHCNVLYKAYKLIDKTAINLINGEKE